MFVMLPLNLVNHGVGFIGILKTPHLYDSISEFKVESLSMELMVCFNFGKLPI